ncbi:hypothetical protein COU37_04815 [Candidatus Micrarchaeota archaeon CG10_big_fil_rev_8_21_14_0_10_45_29]|nr:MAG: hypothetical protein COU37_04815 [Candidatus Micrarchaeota archaeon CG10_big_fil_rev_8_21_14_0_10_45_29]
MKIFFAICLAALCAMPAALPVGVTTVSAGTPVTLGALSPISASAWGGNVTELNLSIASVTLHWQGFYGSIVASLQIGTGSGLANGTLKQWNVSNISGQMYASRSSTVDFTVLNSTSSNLSNLDDAFSFLQGANDAAINSGSNSANPAFNIGQYAVSANSFPLITSRDDSGNEVWNEVIMRHATDGSPSDFVFVGILNNSGVAFNGDSAHFQIVVPEDSAGDATATTYYFYGEIQ